MFLSKYFRSHQAKINENILFCICEQFFYFVFKIEKQNMAKTGFISWIASFSIFVPKFLSGFWKIANNVLRRFSNFLRNWFFFLNLHVRASMVTQQSFRKILRALFFRKAITDRWKTDFIDHLYSQTFLTPTTLHPYKIL